jgi:3-oxoacyl-[acyl-carrier protein] reductase
MTAAGPGSSRTALVTGGAGGLGMAIATRLIADGHRVALLDRAEADPDGAARTFGTTGTAVGIPASVTDPRACGAAVDEVLTRWSRLDVLVNVAGVPMTTTNVADITDDDWDLLIRTHLYGTFHMTRAALRPMLSVHWGRIVNITSSAAWDPGPGIAAYAAAKAGITGFTRSVAAEVGPHGVTVNCVAPGLIATAAALGARSAEVLAARAAVLGVVVPGPRLGRPEEVATAVGYLCSPEAAFTTGSTVHVNGGSYMP